jgi:large subunit ribosomal protein L35
MPKMKTKSAAKKRFKITASGKVKAQAMGKRHGMIKRTNKFIRDARGTMVLAEPDARKVIKNFLPNGGGIWAAPGQRFKEIMTWHASNGA